ncbi:unnamed protein product [Linum tenue]|uniref:Uncharacterized protein n=1 Tax=Linum tenue TaxID=586396 RepID=A0AAV0QDV1_9ROSI|nr:unnamed protein product [Linum tenue]CAI0628850.1 unnamed protein product [Linum tenue]CAI0628870.1 unnamed protein product [Linum tenue]CAI0628890.1 unnamed protein product [Linum tenue]
MLLKLWGWYRNCLTSHPLKTQVISSGFLWGAGDIGAQYVTHSTAIKRLQCTRYEYLDKFIRLRLKLAPKSARFVAAKVAADGIIFGPLDLLVFFTYIGFSTGKSAAQVKEDVKRDFLPSLVLEGGIWPLVQVANFRYVPVQYQLLYVNFFCLIDSAFLSWVDQQKDAPWKQWFKSFQILKERGGQGGL